MVKLVECARDGWQGLPSVVPAEVKADYLRLLVGAGFRHLDAVTFGSKAAVPQMADSERVLEYLDAPAEVELLAKCLDEEGAGRAIATGLVSTLGFAYSLSPTFLAREQNRTAEEALETLEAIGTLGYKAGLEMVAYVTMAFGNPYGDAWDADEVIAGCDLLVDCGVTQITLADTSGAATPRMVADVVADVLAVHDGIELGVKLYGSAESGEEQVRAAYGAGCRRFEASLGGGLAADGMLHGTVPAELVLRVLQDAGAEMPELTGLEELVRAGAEIRRRFGARVQ